MFQLSFKPKLIGLLISLLIFLAAFSWPQQTVYQQAVELREPLAQLDADSRKITVDDWIAHLPVVCATGAVVLAVNGVFIARIIQNRRQSRIEG